jgi:hypothetical protein
VRKLISKDWCWAGHINNQYNTCFWALVHSGLTTTEAQLRLKGTLTEHKNELMFTTFGINYSELPALHRKVRSAPYGGFIRLHSCIWGCIGATSDFRLCTTDTDTRSDFRPRKRSALMLSTFALISGLCALPRVQAGRGEEDSGWNTRHAGACMHSNCA